MQTTSHENSITQGVIWKQLLLFFFPILLGTFFQQLYNTADAIIVGNIAGKEALAAVGGSTATLINLLVGFFVGLSSGTTVIISQFFGARDANQVSRAVHTSVAMAIAGGVILMAVGLTMGPLALEWMNTPADVIDLARQYLCIYFIGTIPSLIYNLGSGVLRAMGDSRRPLYFLIASCLVNIVLDLLLVGGFGMGVAGAALATIISQLVSAVLTLQALRQPGVIYHLEYSKVRIAPEMLANIIRIGLPAGLQSVMYSISNVLIQASINGFGTDVVAAWTAYGKIDCIFWMTLNSFGIAITTFVGQNYGAGLYDRMKKGVRVCLGMAFGTTFFVTAALMAGGQWFFRMFTSDPVVLEYGVRILWYLAPWYLSYVCVEILSGALRGAGEAVAPMLICCIGVCAVRIAWLWLAVPLWPELETVLTSYPVTWVLTAGAFVLYYWKGGWLQRRLRRQVQQKTAV